MEKGMYVGFFIIAALVGIAFYVEYVNDSKKKKKAPKATKKPVKKKNVAATPPPPNIQEQRDFHAQEYHRLNGMIQQSPPPQTPQKGFKWF